MSYILGDFPVYAGGSGVGTVNISQSGLLIVFDCVCSYRSHDVMRLTAICSGKYVPLGVVAPEAGKPSDGKLRLKKSFTRNALAALGYTDAESFHLIRSEDLYRTDVVPIAPPHPEGIIYNDWPDPNDYLDAPDYEIEMTYATRGAAPEPVAEPIPDAQEIQASHPYPPEEAAPAISVSNQPFNLDNIDELTAKLGPILEQLMKPSDTQEAQEPQDMRVRQEEPQFIDGWSYISDPCSLFSDPSVADSCENITGALTMVLEDVELLAVPVSPTEPFPMMPVFCFGSPEEIGGREYIVFRIKDGNLTL